MDQGTYTAATPCMVAPNVWSCVVEIYDEEGHCICFGRTSDEAYERARHIARCLNNFEKK